MGFIDTLGRIPKILESNINALLDKCEDPAKMIDQLLIDYKRDLADVKRDTADVMANLEIAKKQLANCDAEIEKCAQAAKNALVSGHDADAAKIIEKKQKLESTRASLADNVAVCQKNADTMRDGYNKLVANIQDLEQRKDAAKAKIALAKAQDGINKTAAKAAKASSTEQFDRYEQMAEKALAKSNAMAELDANADDTDTLMDKYSAAGGSASVDAEMARMKAELGL